MKIFIQVLDNGYTVSVTRQVRQDAPFPREGDRPALVEEKQRFAFETKDALARKLNDLLGFDEEEEFHGE